MRISGLSSGLDTEQLIKDIMTAERIPVDRVYQQKVRAEWKRDAYRDVNTKLLRLRNLAFDMTLQGTYQKYSASSSNEGALSVYATGRAQPGSFEIEVERLATSARYNTNGGADERFADFAWGEKETVSFTLQNGGGQEVEFTVSKGDSLESIIGEINKTKNLGISAFYDSHTKAVSFATKETGENATIKVVNDNDGFFAAIFQGEISDGDGVLAKGENALLKINGLETERESNNFDLNGVTVNLQETTAGPVQIDVTQDTDAVIEKIKEFVELYNELTGEINIELREDVYRDFPPLTPEQRAELSDKEIEQWEEKAKSGLLRSDRLLSNILNEMRVALGGVVEGPEGSKTLAQIGIKTGSWYEYGRLHLDEDKLRSVLEEDAGIVRDIFTQDGEGMQQGIGRRLTKLLDNGMERISDTAGKASIPYDQSYLGKQIRDYEDRIDAMEERLIRIEQMHWNKFTAMERVLSQLYAQGDWLAQQLTAMMG